MSTFNYVYMYIEALSLRFFFLLISRSFPQNKLHEYERTFHENGIDDTMGKVTY